MPSPLTTCREVFLLGVLATSSLVAQSGPPVITQQPANATVCAGQTLMLTVAATGAAPLTYQWRRNFQPLPGATMATLSIPSATQSEAGVYDVLVANPAGAILSLPAAVRVDAPNPPAIFSVSPNVIPSPWPATARVRVLGIGFTAFTEVRQRSFCEDIPLNPLIIDAFTLEVDLQITGQQEYYLEVTNPGACGGSDVSPRIRTQVVLPHIQGIDPPCLIRGRPSQRLRLIGPDIDLMATAPAQTAYLGGVALSPVASDEVIVPAALLSTARLSDIQVLTEAFDPCLGSTRTIGGNALPVVVAPPTLTMSEGMLPGSLAIEQRDMPAGTILFTAFSLSATNRVLPGQGIWFGLHIGLGDVLDQITINRAPFITNASSAGLATFESINALVPPSAPPVQLFAVTTAINSTATGLLDVTNVSDIVLGMGDSLTVIPERFSGQNRNVVLADFDDDGVADLATSSSIWQGTGTARFDLRLALDPTGLEAAAADFDGDGHQDLVITDSAANPYERIALDAGGPRLVPVFGTSTVIFGDGTGNFSSPGLRTQTVLAGTFDDGRILATDINGDGAPDLVVASGVGWALHGPSGRQPPGVEVLLNDGTGRFTPSFQGLSRTTAVAAGDLNGDGRVDLVASSNLDTILVLYGNGFGGFSTGSSLVIASGAGAESAWLEVADMDGNGRQDIAWCGFREKGVWLNFPIAFQFRPAGQVRSPVGVLPRLAVADLNDDGFLDLVAPLVSTTGGAISVALNDGNGNFPDRFAKALGIDDPGYVIADDLDADGDQDLVIGGSQVIVIRNEAR